MNPLFSGRAQTRTFTSTARPRLLQALWLATAIVMPSCGTDEETQPGTDAGPSDIVDPSDTNSDSGADTTPDSDTSDGSGCSIVEPANHRPTAESCDRERPTGDLSSIPDGSTQSCNTHEECTEGENGRCTTPGRDWWECTYDQCFADADCGTTVCACEGGWGTDNNVCRQGNCQVDADCGAGSFCSPSFGDCGDYSGVVAFYCRTCEDECVNDSDCQDPSLGAGYCAYMADRAHWACSWSQCVGKAGE